MSDKAKIPARIVISLMAAYIATAIMLLILSFLMFRYQISDSALSMGMILSYVLSNILSGVIIGKSMKEKRILWGIMVGALYIVLFVAIGGIIGTMPSISKLILPALLSINGAIIGAILS